MTSIVRQRAWVALVLAIIALAVLRPAASLNLGFDGGRLIDAGTREVGLAVGDFNEDGYPDVATANSNGTADLLINRTDNWFFMASGWPRSATGNNQRVVVADFNNDGHLDAVTVAFDNGLIRVFLGDGAGGILSSLPYSAGASTQPFDVAAADVNGDGYLDLVTANQANTTPATAPTVTVRLNTGSGGFAGGGVYTVGATGALARGVAVGDVTGDGKPDIVVVNSNTNQVRILTGDGTGTFSLSATAYDTARGPRKVVLADFDEDGDLDIATADSGDGVPSNPANWDNRTTILLNDGTGVFTAATGSPFTTGPSGSSPFALKAHDLNGDGHLDLVFVNRHGGTLSVLRGAGDGTFGTYTSIPYPDDYTDAEATDVAVADINNDGRPDLIANASGNPGYLVPFLNTTTIDAPVLGGTTPASPSNNAVPYIFGTADGNVSLFETSDCSGSPVATGTAAQFASPGIQVPVAGEGTHTFYATATNHAGWATSPCSSTSASYLYDATPPDAPTLVSSPASPSSDAHPHLLGSAEPGSTVTIYASSSCGGGAVATGTAADYASPGLSATVAFPSSTTFTATATDAAGNASICSQPLTYAACTVNPVVTTLSDDGADAPNRLRDAVANACAGSTITFSTPGTITLVNGVIELATNVTIDGANAITLQGVPAAQVFRVIAPANATLQGLTIQGGQGFLGGGVSVTGGTLAISNSWIRNNAAFNGGGLGMSGGNVVITGSTISGNQAARGGGIDWQGTPGSGTLLIVNSTISGNTSPGEGGGIFSFAPGTALVNTTVANNRSDINDNAGVETTGGIRSFGTFDVWLRNTIVAGNTSGRAGTPSDINGLFDNHSQGRSTFNLIGAGSNVTGISNGTFGNQMGTPASPIDARLGPLGNNGGPTATHALLSGSPAIDAAEANGFTGVVDQRGMPRPVDGPDADTTAAYDIGAVEQFPSIENIADRTISEDTATSLSPLQITFNLGDASIGDAPDDFESITATSSNQALVADGHLTITGSGSTRTLSIVTEANASGAATITVTAQKYLNGTPFAASDTFVLTVTDVNDAPTLDATPTQTVAEDSGAHTVSLSGITAGPGESQALAVSATSSNPSIVPNPVVTYSSPNATASLEFTPAADKFGTVTITVTVQDAGGIADGGVDTFSRTFDVTVTPVADPPQVITPSTRVNIERAGLVITPNAVDGSEVQFFRITNIQNGTLRVGGTSIAVTNGTVLSRAQGALGLAFTPALNSTATGSFDIVAQLDALGNGASTPVTATIVVNKHLTFTGVSTTPNPSNKFAPVTVSFSVLSTTAGPTPTGSVDVHIAGSSETCSGTLNASGSGSCQFTLADPGAGRQVTVTYPGDSVSEPSVGTTSHTVLACPSNPVVVNTDDSGPGSLRQAIANACATDAITFAIPGPGPHTIVLASQLVINKSLTITGSSDGIRIDGNHATRLFNVTLFSTVARLERLTLMNGTNSSGGGAIQTSATLTIADSTVSGNTGVQNAGAIINLGTLTITGSTFSGNTTSGSGGAIFSGGPLTIVNSTFSGNSAGSYGGAIYADDVPSTLTHVTISGNSAVNRGGGVYLYFGSPITNSIIAGNTATFYPDININLTLLGGNLTFGDPKLGPLQDNGGPTFTRAPLANSPALDAGDNAAAAAAGVTTDQRGVARAFDGPDADTTATVDLGAYEARASVSFADPITLYEDSPGGTFTVNIGSAVTLATATTDVGPLLAPFPDYLSLTDSGTSRQLFVRPASPNAFGTQIVDIAVHFNGDETLHAPLTVNVLPVADTPSITGAAASEDTQTTSGLEVSRSIFDGPEVTHFKVLSVTAGTLYKHDGVTPIAVGSFVPFAEGAAGLRFTPAPNSTTTGVVSVQASTSASDAGLGGASVSANILIGAVADAPVVASVTTLEDTQSGPITIQANPVDASSPPSIFKITNITGGTLAFSGGGDIHDGDFIAVAAGAAGVTFTPAANSIAPGHFTAQAAYSTIDSLVGPVGTTATITVTPVADTPSATAANTYAQVQSSSGLRLARNAVDGAEVTHFKISALGSGTLFQHDGTTPIADGAFITFAQGDAGLKFTPSNGFVGAATFQVQAATDGAGAGLSPAAIATITVDKNLTQTTITSHTPNPVNRNTSLNVSYSVASTTGGPAPTGTVTVALGSKSCTGTVAAGHCIFSPNTGGTGQTLTATYNGDSLSQGSTTSVLQDVNLCPTKFVTTTADSGPGSLRQAIAGACSRDLVMFNIPGAGPHTIVLTSGPLVVDKVIWFFGPLDARMRISGNHASRVFDVTSAGATFTGLEIVDGAADEGAGIRTAGGITLDGVTLSGNAATVKGGALLVSSSAPYVEIFGSTISGNSAPAGSAAWSDGPLFFVNATVTANTGGATVVNSNPGSTTANSIIAGNGGIAVTNTGLGGLYDIGNSILTGDPMLGPLQDNGGPTFTHMPLPGSPAIDGGDNNLIIPDSGDQRGFARIADGPDADAIPIVDIGAVEVLPSVALVPATATAEDTPTSLSFRLGTIAEPLDTIVATSSDQALVPNASLVITGSGDSRTLTMTPTANRYGTATITIAATAQILNQATSVTGPLTGTSSFQLTVTPVADTPSITNATAFINAQTSSGLVITPNALDGAEVTHYRVTTVTGGTLFQHDGVTPIAAGDFVTAAQGAAGLRFTPAPESTATGHVSVQASIGGTIAGLNGGVATADITIDPHRGVTISTTSSVNPAVVTSPVSIQAAVVTGGHGTATGTMVFKEGTTVLATLPLVSGAAVFATSTFAIGTHHLTIDYSGDGAFAPASATFDQIVTSGRTALTGADAGAGSHVRRFTALDGVPAPGAVNSFFAFAPGFTGGVRVAEGDVNGDGVPDYIAGAGPGGAPQVSVFDGATGGLLTSFMAFAPGFSGGVFVAAGDVDGDGFADVVVAPGSGAAAEVKVFSGRDWSVIRDGLAFASTYTGGATVAAGDVNGDGFADVIAGAASGSSAVTVLSGRDLSVLRSFTAYGTFAGGVFVAAGDVNGDGFADIITGAGAGGGPQVRVLDGVSGAEVADFFAFDPAFTGGVRVAAGDVNGDGRADVFTAAGPGGAPQVSVFDGATFTQLSSVLAYAAAFRGGVFVATAVPIGRMTIDSPASGASVHGAFMLGGWAFEDGASDAGIERIDVVAQPVDGTLISLGHAELGDLRPDVGAAYGAAYGRSGFHFLVPDLRPTVYDLRLTAVSARSHTEILRRTIRITVVPAPSPLLAIDVPAAGRLASGDFAVAGWALTLDTPPAPGVDAVDVWAEPVAGTGGWRFLGSATLGIARPDVGAVYGAGFANAGYALTVTGLPQGTWDVHVYARATGASTFATSRTVRVTVPGALAGKPIITGADAGGGPHVRRFNALDGLPPETGALNSFFAFDAFFGGVRVASGDVNGDGVADVIAGAGPGGLPEIRIFDGASGGMLSSYLAFESSFRGGVFVAAGDVDGDGIVDVIAGSGAGRVGEVKVFRAGSPVAMRDQFVFDGFTGGVHVGAGDVNGDGRADLVVGSGAGMPAEVRVLHSDTGATLRTIHPYGAFVGGVFVAAGDVTGDGYADIVTGSDAGGGPHVQVFDGVTGAGVRSFYAFDPSFAGGVRVAAGDVTGDGLADVIVGSGPGITAAFRVFDGASGTLLSDVPAYGPFLAGTFVATEAPVNRMSADLPANGATVHGPFTIGGWALVDNPANAGIAAIHVWAVPVGGGAPTFVGLATLGDARPDIAALFGAQYAHAGFHLEAASLPPGVYDLAIAAQSTVTGTFQMMRVVRVTIAP